ncbi:TetR family transcriptional regulator [Nocardia sp. SYP-A9097]|uniref:TetR/AcrR family transcriptional regulator n=1 Tax=Nocardia sp. SYP-A9097 TaxID=2663237 RepID=UPI00129B345A|nr:TetR/AcrR family transcriptional regulator [Nocardia sp. SYP-A9097]MRH87765.1 TetR family transcriptional regulator [Nocardia sp. SYP-A9097]
MGVRDRVLQAALDCFSDEGYERTTIARIRERSAVSNGALFHHFSSKDAIAGALYVDSIQSIHDGYRRVLAAGPTTLADVVGGLIRHQLSWIEANVARARFLYSQGRLDWSTDGGTRLRSMNDDIADAYREWLAPLITRGEVRDLPMAVMVAVITGPAHALAGQWLAGQLPGSLIDHAEELSDAAVRGLGGNPSEPAGHTPRHVEGRVRVQLLDADGAVLAETEVTSLNSRAH